MSRPPYFDIDPDAADAQLGAATSTDGFAAIAQNCQRGRDDLAARGLDETGRKKLRMFSAWEITKYLIPVDPAVFRQTLRDNPDLPQEICDFYRFHSGLLEAWDGPALLVFSDGKSIGASLDRNGLRPARYSITNDGTVFLMSETGVIPNLPESTIVRKGRLGPGQMVHVDLATGEFKDNLQIKSEIAQRE